MDKKTILAFVLIGLIFLLWPYYNKLVYKDQIQPVPVEQVEDTVNREDIRQEDLANQKSETRPVKEKTAQIPAKQDSTINQIDSSFEEKFYTFKNDKMKLVFSNRGAVLAKVYLYEYKQEIDEDQYVDIQLIPNQSYKILNSILKVGNMEIDLSDYPFEFVEASNQLIAESNISLSESDTLKVKKIFSFNEKKYSVNLSYQIESPQKLSSHIVEWNHSLNTTEEDIQADLKYFTVYAKMGDEITEEKIANDEDEEIIERTGSTHWVGLKSKYFLAAMACDKNASGILLKGEEKDKLNKKIYAGLKFKNENAMNNELMIYMGPIDYIHLKSFGIKLEKTVNLGWKIIQPFSVMLTYLLIYMQKVISNYGVIIILFSLLIKLVTYPLTHKSYEATKKMTALQPKMNEIRKKYEKDPAKMNKATMDLYKKEGINPAGGCLPMLLQMPIFFALYQVFDSTIMLRNQSFFWIDNLAGKDPTLIMPIAMTALSLVQNMLTMKDPKQKMMVYILPIVMFMIFKNLAAGLVLYWTCFNLFTIIQQELVNKYFNLNKKKKAVAKAVPAHPSKKKK